MEITLKNHRICCRICFKPNPTIEITDEIQNKFYSITGLDLKKSSLYSLTICETCNFQLSNYIKFRNNIFQWQSRLYEEYPENIFIKPDPESEILHEYVNIKLETELDDDDGNYDENLGFNDNLELLRDNMEAFHEPVDESPSFTIEKPKKSRGPRSGDATAIKKERRICPDCGHHVMDLTRHWRRSHSKIINFICDLCGYGTLMRHRLVLHMKNKHFPKEERVKFQCGICDFQTVNRSYLQIHEKSHSSQPSEHRCHCGKEFLSKHILAQHILMVHERAFKFKCPYCPKAYPCRKAQKEHILTQHTKKDIRDKICEICAKAFITESQLSAHLKEVHTEGSIPCEIQGCPKRFHKISKLKRHMKMHTQEKNFRCDQCTNAYSHASHLYRHQEAVHLGLVFPCAVPGCQTNFRRRDNYRVHLMKSHKDLPLSFVEELMKRSSTKPVVLQ